LERRCSIGASNQPAAAPRPRSLTGNPRAERDPNRPAGRTSKKEEEDDEHFRARADHVDGDRAGGAGLFLGQAYLKTRRREILVLYFGLEKTA
jgi:hypothetical protein